MIEVAVAGCSGRMGQAVVDAVTAAPDLEVVCGIDPAGAADAPFPVYPSVSEALAAVKADVLVDFTRPDVAAANMEAALAQGVNCVLGTTGLSEDDLTALAAAGKEGTSLFYAPNFTTGAVLMMQFAKAAAPYFPQAEIIEFHHCRKKDAPSGTAMMTAHLIAEARKGEASKAPGKETELDAAVGARGALVEGIPIHSLRSDGFVADQEVVFGSLGQTLSVKHVSWDTQSYMPGVLLGIRESSHLSGLVIGLESLMSL
jgi:4-hydroxy-tetrahydrodipicolinate reductase